MCNTHIYIYINDDYQGDNLSHQKLITAFIQVFDPMVTRSIVTKLGT